MNNKTKASDSASIQSQTPSSTNLADLIWRNAEVLTGAFKPAEYRKVILPMLVLRRIDCLLEATKDAVLTKHREIAPKNYDLRMFLAPITGFPFWNTSNFTITKLLEDPDNLKANIEDLVSAFSPNVRRVFEMFGFMATIAKLEEKKRLYLVVKNFAQVRMDQKSVSAHDMGTGERQQVISFATLCCHIWGSSLRPPAHARN